MMRSVAGILQTVLAADEQPARTTSDSFEKVQWVHGIDQSLYSEGATLVRRLAIAVEVGDFGRLVRNDVGLVGERPQVHNSEDEHLDVNQELRQSVLEITERNLVGGLDCTARDQQANQNLGDVCQ